MKGVRQMQTIASVFLFILIHVPLSRISPYFSMITALIPLTLAQPTKQYIYQLAREYSFKLTCSQPPAKEVFTSTCKQAEGMRDTEIRDTREE